MKFMDKETLEARAEELGVTLDGLTWPKRQAAVYSAMAAAGLLDEPEPEPRKEAGPVRTREELMDAEELAKLRLLYERERSRTPQVPVVKELGLNDVEPTIEDYDRATVIISPGQAPTQNQPLKYHTTVGTVKQTEDVVLGVGRDSPFSGEDMYDANATRTYRVRDTGQPQVLESTLPKYGCRITYKPGRDLVAVATYEQHSGYLWKHHLMCVKDLLDQMGCFEKYKHLWFDANKIFYLGGLVCADIPFTDEMLRRIGKRVAQGTDRDELA